MSIPALKTKPIQKSYLSAKAATGDYLDTLGTLSITIRLDDEIFTHHVQVLRNTTQPVLLGLDFVRKHHAILDLRADQLTIGNRAIVSLLRATRTALLSCSAVTLAPIVIPAMSQMNIMAKVQSVTGEPEDMSAYTGMLEPGPPSLPGLLVPRTLAPVKTGITYVRIMNPTNSDCHVPCDTRLGDFHSLGSQEGEKFSTEEVTTAAVAEVKSHSPSESMPRVDLSQFAVTDEQRQQLEALLLTHSDVFSAHDQDCGRTSVVKHSIKTGDASRWRQ